jgi:hypothetical protein
LSGGESVGVVVGGIVGKRDVCVLWGVGVDVAVGGWVAFDGRTTTF